MCWRLAVFVQHKFLDSYTLSYTHAGAPPSTRQPQPAAAVLHADTNQNRRRRRHQSAARRFVSVRRHLSLVISRQKLRRKSFSPLLPNPAISTKNPGLPLLSRSPSRPFLPLLQEGKSCETSAESAAKRIVALADPSGALH